MAWWDLAEAGAGDHFRALYDRALAQSLRTWGAFLPGHPEKARVMDRLHAFIYFLEGLLPRVNDPMCAAALCGGIRSVAHHLRDIAPEFERADVYAQLLRIRLYADRAGVTPLDRDAASFEAARLAEFQTADGGFCFGRSGESRSPHISPVPTSFGLQALAMWSGETVPHRHLLI